MYFAWLSNNKVLVFQNNLLFNPLKILQIFGDPEAADLVFTAGINTQVIGINLTTQVILNGEFALYLNKERWLSDVKYNFLPIDGTATFLMCGTRVI